jgi:predicted HAD superfamily Cof-like phosphohydrolase
MTTWLDLVKCFFRKHQFPQGKKIEEESDNEVNEILQDLGSTTYRLSQELLYIANRSAMYSKDHRVLRAQLQLEETAEFIIALSQKDSEQTVDAIVDMIYCAIGSGITYGYPMNRSFDIVHRSNMTKPKSHDPRLKEKPKGYEAPDWRDIE